MKKPSYFPKKPQGFLCHSLDITFAILENERRIKGDVKGWLKAFDEILCFLKHNYADNIIGGCCIVNYIFSRNLFKKRHKINVNIS